MSALISFLERRFVPIAAKIGGQKHLMAVRDAFAGLLPLVMAGAFAVLLNNVFFVSWGLLAEFLEEGSSFIAWTEEHIAPLFSLMESGTFAILALGLVFSLGYNRALAEDKDPLTTGLINIGVFVMLGALHRDMEVVEWVTNYLAAQGIFIAMIVGLLAPEIYFAIVRKNWVIKMPEQVPPAVTRGFLGVIPGFITVLAFGIVAYIFQQFLEISIFAWFETNIAEALMAMGQNLLTIVVISFLIPLFWFFGLHGANILEAVMQPLYGVLTYENVDLFTEGITVIGSGANELSVWVRGSWDAYVFMGGSGATLPLIAAFLIFSKVKEHREIAKLGAAPGIFMINEPILFGIPIVLNPIFLIPFILVQPVLTIVAYLATTTGIAGPLVNVVPWTTPPILNAYLATNGSWGSVLVSVVNLALAFIIYLPFVVVANRHQEKIEEQRKLAS